MKVTQLKCPACGAGISDNFVPNQQVKCAACGSLLVLTDLVTTDQIVCSQCKTLHGATQHFCLRCGAKLQQACPFCYASTPIAGAYCRRCGVDLQSARQRKEQWLAEERQHTLERSAALEQTQAVTRASQLQQALADLGDPTNHPWALYCLKQVGEEAVEPLIHTLRTADEPAVRLAAAQALGNSGDARAIPVICAALTDREALVRYWAVDALVRLQAQRAQTAIAQLVDNPHEAVLTQAQAALQQLAHGQD